MSKKIMIRTGWVLSIAIGLMFAMSAFLKITQNPAAIEQAAGIGLDAGTYQMIGFIEILSLILFFIPRTGVLGALLLIAYMGGAIVTHLQNQQPIGMAVGVQVLLWVAAFLRYPELWQRLVPAGKGEVLS
jgi:hypothetical protein